MKIQIEHITNIIEELFPLWIEHWLEIKAQHFRPEMKPNLGLYLDLDAHGSYHMVTLRDDDGNLAGYIGDIVQENLHYSELIASCDLMYIKPEYRKSGMFHKMVKLLEDFETQMGVVERYMSFKDVGPEKKGYRQIERLMVKRLGV